jgi:hypothetical protein
MDPRRASLPLKILYALVAAMLLWAIIWAVMAADLVGQAGGSPPSRGSGRCSRVIAARSQNPSRGPHDV